MIVSFVKTLIGLAGATLLFWVGIAYEHRPAGWPNIATQLPFGLHWTLKLPDGPFAQLTTLQAQEAAAGRAVVALEARQAVITSQASRADDVTQARIQTITRTLIQKVPVYVDRQDVADCRVNVGFVRLFNAAATGVDPGSVPGAASQSNDAASGVGLDTVASVTISDFGAANANAQQLADLQAWVRAQEAANPPK